MEMNDKEKNIDLVDCSNFENHKPYDIQKLKKLPMDIRINKIIDVIDYLTNKGFNSSTKKFYKELSSILKD